MHLKYCRIFLVTLLSFTVFISCQKGIVDTSATTGTADDKIKDTVLLDSKDIYLWYSQIPASFNARSYADPSAIMTAIRQYSIEPGFTAAVDKWSFAMKQADWNNLSSGVSGDFGLGVFFFVDGDLRVKSVERESPAGKAAIRRSWKVTKINGNTNITIANSDFIVQNVFHSANSSFTFLKPDGSSVDITLTAASYNTHPVMLDSVYTVGSKKIGYMVLNSFLGDTTELYSEFNRIASRFSAAGVNDVVVDLRYNGGGYVSVQEKLANYLAPTSATGNLMMKQQYNDKYSQYNTSTVFKKAGSLNLSRVFFIVSSSTASASELIINDLKTYMDVKLIGPNNTDGKPVGFFNIPVGDWYIFPVSFRSTNSAGSGNYFNGFTPDSKVGDGLTYDWGNVSETCLASAIKYITTGAFRLQADQSYTEQPQITKGNALLDINNFKGTISTRRIIK